MKQSELLRKQADMMDMAEKYGIDDWRELVWVRDRDGECWWHPGDYLTSYSQHRFALGVVEGKPVFEGDELWNVPNNFKFSPTIARHKPEGLQLWDDRVLYGQCGGWLKDLSWNPPKPKTVMVEMPIDVAEWVAAKEYYFPDVAEACRKALKQLE